MIFQKVYFSSQGKHIYLFKDLSTVLASLITAFLKYAVHYHMYKTISELISSIKQ